MNHSRMSMFLLGATLALGFSLSAYIAGRAAVRVSMKNTIRVKGFAMKSVTSDFGIWSGSIQTRAKTLEQGYAKLNADQKLVTEFLMKQGFDKNEFFFESISIRENLKRDAKGYATSFVEDYSLLQKVSVSSSKVSFLEKTARNFTSLVKQGVFAKSGAVCYTISKLDSYKLSLLTEATENARARAVILAEKSGGKVGRLVSASQGIFQITAPASSVTSDYGEYDKSTMLKEIKAVVTLEFKVE